MPPGICVGLICVARILAASANNAAYTLNLMSSKHKIVIVELKEDSNTVGFCRSSDNGGGEEVVNEIWTPMAEATRKGIFSRLMVLCWTVFGACDKSF